MAEPADGRQLIEQEGLSYLPRFISQDESQELIDYFAALRPIWERRHHAGEHARSGCAGRRLTRPVYWLGAWQFACLGYYAEPEHRVDRCLRAEGLPPVMQGILERLGERLVERHSDDTYARPSLLPNTCLINFYGREVGHGVPVDYARLRMHRDLEPGPVIVFSIGQPARLEFLDPDRSLDPEIAVWARHRSVTIMSGPKVKEHLYHRVAQVRTGQHPEMSAQLAHFELRRVSISFRHVPEELISDFIELPKERQDQVRGYVQELAEHSEHFRAQLGAAEA